MITGDEIIKLARLSKLYVREEELDAVTADMDKIIGFADEVSRARVNEEEFDNINGLENIFREDEVIKSADRELILKNADGGGNDGFFYVKKYK